MREDEKTPLTTVRLDLDKYDLMALEQALTESRASGWSSDEANDRTLVTNKLREAAAKLSILECQPPSTAVKILALRPEGDGYLALISAPLESIHFELNVARPPNVSGVNSNTDTKPCPTCGSVFDPNGECVNARCPNWIKV